MGRLSKRQRDRLYNKVAFKELYLHQTHGINIGEYCRACGIQVQKDKEGPHEQGLVDCMNNSGDHRDLENLQLLCRGCNHIKNPRGPSNRGDSSTMTWSEAKNKITERKFGGWVLSVIGGSATGQYDFDDLVVEGAVICDNSEIPNRRHLKKLTCRLGPLEHDKRSNAVYFKNDEAMVERWFARRDAEGAYVET